MSRNSGSRQQYSGAEHGLVRGIGVVNLVHSDGETSYPIDCRIYAPQVDGHSKNDLMAEMLMATMHKGIQARTILFDSWYASVENLKLIAFLKMVFITSIPDNRLVSLSKAERYIHVQDIDWTPERLANGVSVKLKKLSFRGQLLKVVAPDGDIDDGIGELRRIRWQRSSCTQDLMKKACGLGFANTIIVWMIANHPDSLSTQDVQNENARRWQIEQFHRGLKQLPGSEKCQCRQARSQRNHLDYCYLAWLALRLRAQELHLTLHQVRHRIFDDFLTEAQLYRDTWKAGKIVPNMQDYYNHEMELFLEAFATHFPEEFNFQLTTRKP